MENEQPEEENLAHPERETEPFPDGPDEVVGMPYMYDAQEMQVVESHIAEYFGEFSMVLHEIFSPDIHVDICLIPPRPQDGRNYYTLVTMGMGAYAMNVPEELVERNLMRAELVINLPADWHMEEGAMQDERWYWPIRLLKTIARLPLEEESWVGWGHTIGMEEGETYAENTTFCGSMLATVDMFDEDGFYCTLPGGDDVNFYYVLPLYKDEMEFKLAHDADALLELFGGCVPEVLDIRRASVILE